MDKLFISVLNMSLTAAYVVIGICLARIPLKKAPKYISYALWAVAWFRFAVPFSLEAAFSLIPVGSQPIPADIIAPAQTTGGAVNFADYSVTRIIPAAGPAKNPMAEIISAGTYIWLAGIAVLLIYSIVSFIRLKLSLRGAAPCGVSGKNNANEASGTPLPVAGSCGVSRAVNNIENFLRDETQATAP